MTRSHHSGKLLHGQRGSATIWFAVILPVLLGFAALAVDLARLNLVRTELQNAADAATLAGARSLSDAGGTPYNWSAATTAALAAARRNFANADQIQDATIETGYWNLQNPSLGLRSPGTPGTPGAGDIAAIRVTITISSTKNHGPVQLFFAPILGIDESDMQASAVAVLPVAGGGTGIFPFVINKKMLDHFWDLATSTPILKNGVAPTINLGSIYNFDGACVLSGQWTTFQSNEKNPSTTYIENLIRNGNSAPLSIGQNTYIQPGAKASLYSKVPVGTDVALFVVNNVDSDSFQPVVAIAAFHIDGYNQGAKYITGHFIPNANFGTTTPGSGNGIAYGAYTPSLLVK